MFKLSLQSRGHSCNNLVKTLILRYSKCAAAKTVELPMGKVRGTHEEGHCGNDFYSFRGIPYGKPPIRELRFSPTQPAEPWGNMVLDCTKDRSVPTQVGISSNQITGSEDCLYINVYTKHFDESEKKLPVIVNFTPGGFCTGGAITEKFGPQYLMREDIVYVMFNYRLSALGFLRINCPELGVSGNAGLHDHLTAMRWVQEYISYFNGDPDNVTIMGTSSGGAMVDFMMCAPQASGLFHRAVMMSGTMTCPWAIVPYADDLFCRLAWEKGYRGEIKATEILKFLRSLPAKEVVSLNHFGDCDYLFGHLYPFAPLVQAPSGNDGGEDALIKGPVVEMYRTAWSVDVPLLIGGTSFEGLFMYPKYKDSKGKMLKMLKKNPALALPYEIHTKLSKTEREKAAEELMRFHFGHRPIDKNSVIQFLDFFSYKLFWHGIHRVVLSRLAHARAPTFLYRFSYDSPTPIVRPYFTGKDITCGVCHAEDMAYLFPLKNRTPRMSGDENLITQRMVGILTTFARTGNPNCEETKSVLWKPLRNEDPFQAMLIDQKLKFGTQSEKEVLLMWDKLYDNHNSLLFGG